MEYRVHDTVLVKKIKQIGEVIELIGPTSVRVAVGALTITCNEADIEPATRPVSKHKDLPGPKHVTVIATERTPKQLERLDLHGLTVNEATRRFEEHLNQAAVAGVHQFAVVHGHGTGRVREAIHAYLRSCPIVREFKVDEFNSGITRVFL